MRNPSASWSSPSPSTASATNKSTPCCSKVGLKRGPWKPEEDELLSNYIKKEGEGRWRTLPKRAGLLRCGKSCRLRWMNYLRPNVKRGQIAPDEEDLILRLHRLLGNRWSLIAGRIPGRTDNEIKNYWNTHLSKKLISQGIDPRTHKPLNQVDSSKANRNSSSNPNLRTPNSPIVGLSESGYLLNTLVDDDQNGTTGNNGYMSLLMNCDQQSRLGLESNKVMNNVVVHHEGHSNEDDEDINYCTDDVFSSFLNSLINEDAFACQRYQQQQQLANGSAEMPATGSSEPLVSIAASTFGLGANQNESNRVNEHVE